MNFADTVYEAVKAKNSVACVGLDPRLEQIPKCVLDEALAAHGETIEAAAHAFFLFNKGIIDAVCDLVPMVKPQVAFYEALGPQGMIAFAATCAYAKKRGLLVLADAKRGDIGSTAEAYSQAFLGETLVFGEAKRAFDCDAVTVNPYLGFDGIRPFLKDCQEFGRGIFVLVKTSNPSSGDLQDRVTVDENMPINELIGCFVDSWGSDFIGESGYSNVGAVVGATYPKQVKSLREIMPNTLFLLPGYGAQGASAKDLSAAFDDNGFGALVVSARDIIFAYEKIEGPSDASHYEEASRQAVLKMNSEINELRHG